MIEDILTAIPLGIFLAFLLGPVFFVLLETAALKGFRAALAFDLGVIFADVVFLFIAYLSTNKLLASLKDDPALFIFGGVILVTYGIMSLIKIKKVVPHEDDTPEIRKLSKSDYLGLAAKGFLLNFINIGVLGFWLGLIIVFGPKLDMQSDRISVFFTAVLVSYLIVDIAKILLAKRLNKNLTPNRIYLMKKVISVVMIVFGWVLISQGIFPSEIKKIRNSVDNMNTDAVTFFQFEKSNSLTRIIF